MKWNTGLSMIRDFFSKFFQLFSLMQISKLLIFFNNVTIGDVLTSKYILQRPSVVSLLPCLETFVFGIQWTPPIYAPRQEALNYIFYKTVFLLNIALTLHPAAGLVALVSANLSSYWIGLVVPHDILQNGADTKILLIRVILKYQCWVFVSTQNGIYLSLY